MIGEPIAGVTHWSRELALLFAESTREEALHAHLGATSYVLAPVAGLLALGLLVGLGAYLFPEQREALGRKWTRKARRAKAAGEPPTG